MSESARRGPPPLPNANPAEPETHPRAEREGMSSAPPAVRRPAVAVPNPFLPPTIHMPPPAELHTRTLAPPEPLEFNAPIRERAESPRPRSTGPTSSTPLWQEPAEPHAHDTTVQFPERGLRILESGAVALSISEDFPFATRLDAIAACHAELRLDGLERHHRGKATGEPFGGQLDPVVLVQGRGALLLAPRRGRRITCIELHGETCFLHEIALAGFLGDFSYDNGRLTTSEHAWLPLVQLAGTGPILVEDAHDIVTLSVYPAHGLTVRSASLLGWAGAVHPKAIAPEEAPCFQPNLVRFTGKGRVFLRTQRTPASFESDSSAGRG